MIPTFLVGCTACELFYVVAAERTADGHQQQLPPWHKYGSLTAEAMLVAYVVLVTLVPVSGDWTIHGFTLFWGIFLFILASFPGWAGQGQDQKEAGGLSVGIRWLLESDFANLLGDISLQVYALQRPLR